MTEQRITFAPDPPEAGKSLKICYEFDGSGITSTTLTVTFGPDGDGANYPVSTDNPCVTITVPNEADDITVEDSAGVSPTKAAPVV